ncbi:MAG: AAA family ATPase [Devosia sp.]
MIDLLNSDPIDDEVPDFDSPRLSIDGPPSTAEVAARLLLEAALTRQSRAILRQSPRLIILKVPHADWVQLIAGTLRDMDRAPYICSAAERRRSGGVLHRVGVDNLRYLSEGRSVLYLSPDPDEILDESVLAASDVTITVPLLTPAVLRKLICKVTGGVARGVTEAMASLNLQVILSVVRADLTAGACVRKLAAAVLRRQAPMGAPVPLLTELPLTDVVRRWTDQQLADLSAAKSGAMDPANLVFGLLDGPPGTGKTLIAESLARTSGWKFVPSTVGGWFTSGDGALGGVARNVKGFVDAVLASEPAIGFLDELDAIPNRDTIDNRGRDWWTPVINLCLTEIDRLRRSGKRVLLLGATNHYHRLDGALVRPGRMQQRVTVLPPATEAEVEAVFRYYLRNEMSATELGKLLRFGIGATPAMVEGWVKEARSVARAASRPLTRDDLLGQMLPEDHRSEADIRLVALHEVGHAVVAHRLGFQVDRVSIVAEGDAGGHTRTTMTTLVPNWERIRDQVTVTLAGRAADIVLGSGPNTGAESDLAHATALLLQAFERQGLGEMLVSLPNVGTRHPDLLKTINAEMNRQLERAMAILEMHRTSAMELAQRLIDERVLTGADVAKALPSDPERANFLPLSRRQPSARS